MRIASKSAYLVAVTLLAVLVFTGAIFYRPSFNGKESTFIPKTMSAHGNLTSYTLIMNCTFKQPPNTAPVLVQSAPSISIDQAKEIALRVFGMTAPAISNEGVPGLLHLSDAHKDIMFYGVNQIGFGEDGHDTDPPMMKWDPAKIQQISDDFVKSVSGYWKFDTDANLRVTGIFPSAVQSTVSLDGTVESTIVKEVGVSYVSSVQGIDLVGMGADFWTSIANEKVIFGELRMPAVKVAGQQTVTIRPEDAVKNFINGWSPASSLGVNSMAMPAPANGTCVIDDVRLCYLVTWSYQNGLAKSPPLVYQLTGKLVYNDPSDGSQVTEDFVDYQYATG